MQSVCLEGLHAPLQTQKAPFIHVGFCFINFGLFIKFFNCCMWKGLQKHSFFSWKGFCNVSDCFPIINIKTRLWPKKTHIHSCWSYVSCLQPFVEIFPLNLLNPCSVQDLNESPKRACVDSKNNTFCEDMYLSSLRGSVTQLRIGLELHSSFRGQFYITVCKSAIHSLNSNSFLSCQDFYLRFFLFLRLCAVLTLLCTLILIIRGMWFL